MMTKKTVLLVGLGTLIIFILIGLVNQNYAGFCRYVNENGHTTEYCSNFIFTFMPLLLFIPFSALLYFFRDEVFRAWWRFARWWVPVIIVVTLLLQNAGGGGGLGIGGAVSSAFDALILIILYSIFIITSLVKIVRAYLKGNHQNKIRRDLNSPN